jgi:hypothetical protein
MSRAKQQLPAESEESLQAKVMQLAKLCGWRVVHFRPARTAKGWRTAFTGDKGFLDTVMVRRSRLIFAELKSDDGELTPEQNLWVHDLVSLRDSLLEDSGPVEVYVWRPADWDEIVRILR